MHGKVYRCAPENDNKFAIFISFGGLLMRLKGDTRSLQEIELDSMLYLLIRKTS
jgi:DNA-directed RNA polymerase I, II, and III subunit RPABC3